jgi:Glycosyl hydrolase family 12
MHCRTPQPRSRTTRASSRPGRRRLARLPLAALVTGALATPLLSLTPATASPAAGRSSPPTTTLGPATVAPMQDGPGTAPPPVTGSGPPTQLCEPNEYLNIDGPWGRYVIKNNDFHPTTAPECIGHYKSGPNFGVTQSSATAHGSESDAYPNIFVGCSWGKCSHDSALPARLTAVPHPWVSWYARLQPRGKWDANLDIWLSYEPRRNGQVTGAEVMIWLSARGFGPVRASQHIDGIGWSLVHWTTRSLTLPQDHWPLIIFRSARPRNHVRRLYLQPFFRDLERLHLISRGEWIDSVHGGFEIWNGGQGMRMNWFRAGGGLEG